jgi:acetoin utilization protein AcuC
MNKRRLEAFRLQAEATGLTKAPQIQWVEPTRAGRELLTLFHTDRYVKFVERASEQGTGFLDNGDTPAFTGLYDATAFVVGSTANLLDLMLRGNVDHSFNPMGGLHHARRDRAGGFCVFNDAGIAIELARHRHGLKRILYVDIDAHHGDGVFYEYYRDPDLWVADIHEDGRYLYPGTGGSTETGGPDASGTKLNIPMPPGAGDEEFATAFERVEKFATKAAPELVILQCGADGLRGDPLTHLAYTAAAHRRAAVRLHDVAHRHCAGRLLALGGGGYNPANVAEAWTAVIRGISGGGLG